MHHKTCQTAIATAAVAIAVQTHAQFDASVPHAQPTLIADTDGLAPGHTSHLALRFKIDPKWHIYWRGQNDSGGPVELDLTLPDGITAGPILWPTPKRYVTEFSSDFKLVDYTYERDVLLLIPVTVSDTFPHELARISADLKWVECADVCLFQDDTKTLTLPVGDGRNTPSTHADAIAETRANLPELLPKKNPPVTVKRVGDDYVLNARDATTIAFFPDQDGCSLKDISTHGSAKGTTLTLPIQTDGDNPDAPLAGLIQITTRDSRTPITYSLPVPRPADPNTHHIPSMTPGSRP